MFAIFWSILNLLVIVAAIALVATLFTFVHSVFFQGSVATFNIFYNRMVIGPAPPPKKRRKLGPNASLLQKKRERERRRQSIVVHEEIEPPSIGHSMAIIGLTLASTVALTGVFSGLAWITSHEFGLVLIVASSLFPLSFPCFYVLFTKIFLPTTYYRGLLLGFLHFALLIVNSILSVILGALIGGFIAMIVAIFILLLGATSS